MNSNMPPESFRLSEAIIMPQGSLVALALPREAFLALAPLERYILDQPAAELWMSESGDYCRIYQRDAFDDMIIMLNLAQLDAKLAAVECHSQFDMRPSLPSALNPPHMIDAAQRRDVPAADGDDEDALRVIPGADVVRMTEYGDHAVEVDGVLMKFASEAELSEFLDDYDWGFECFNDGPESVSPFDGTTLPELLELEAERDAVIGREFFGDDRTVNHG